MHEEFGRIGEQLGQGLVGLELSGRDLEHAPPGRRRLMDPGDFRQGAGVAPPGALVLAGLGHRPQVLQGAALQTLGQQQIGEVAVGLQVGPVDLQHAPPNLEGRLVLAELLQGAGIALPRLGLAGIRLGDREHLRSGFGLAAEPFEQDRQAFVGGEVVGFGGLHSPPRLDGRFGLADLLQHLGQAPPGPWVGGRGGFRHHPQGGNGLGAAGGQKLGQGLVGLEVPLVGVLDPAPGLDRGVVLAGLPKRPGELAPGPRVLTVELQQLLQARDRVGVARLVDQQGGGRLERLTPQGRVQLGGLVEAGDSGVEIAGGAAPLGLAQGQPPPLTRIPLSWRHQPNSRGGAPTPAPAASSRANTMMPRTLIRLGRLHTPPRPRPHPDVPRKRCLAARAAATKPPLQTSIRA